MEEGQKQEEEGLTQHFTRNEGRNELGVIKKMKTPKGTKRFGRAC